MDLSQRLDEMELAIHKPSFRKGTGRANEVNYERVYIETTDIHEWFLKNAERYDNIRILKSKMENAIFEKLTDHFIIMTGSMAEGTQDRV